MVEIGKQAPDFCATDYEDNEHCLGDYRGKWVVLYFYPKDNTSGCTIEAVDFTGAIGDLEGIGATVIGVSPDSGNCHRSFIEKYDLKVTLLSDPEHEILESYSAWKEKKIHGKTSLGVQRSTVIIDPQGRISQHWPKVSAEGHVDQVLAKLKELTD